MASELYEVVVKDPVLREVFRELGRHMSLGKPADTSKAGNFDARYLSIPFTAANTEHRVSHGLSRIPVAWIQVGDFTVGSTTGLRLEATNIPTSTYLYLKCNEVKTVKILIW